MLKHVKSHRSEPALDRIAILQEIWDAKATEKTCYLGSYLALTLLHPARAVVLIRC